MPNLKKIAQAIFEIQAAKIWFLFLLFFLLLLFAHFAKSEIKNTNACFNQAETWQT